VADYQEVPMDWCTRLNDGRVEFHGLIRIDGFVRGIHADRIDGFSVVWIFRGAFNPLCN
jgi:hypothetical protein